MACVMACMCKHEQVCFAVRLCLGTQKAWPKKAALGRFQSWSVGADQQHGPWRDRPHIAVKGGLQIRLLARPATHGADAQLRIAAKVEERAARLVLRSELGAKKKGNAAGR